jgi:hypothetical protein
LVLSHNCIKDEGCLAITESILKNPYLALNSIDLAFNFIGEEGAIGIGDAISSNCKLQNLYL